MIDMRKWCKLPPEMQCAEVKEYYEILLRHSLELQIKRGFDIVMSACLILVLVPVFVFIAIWIKMDSSGSIFFRQVRVTRYGERFKIFKFRTMIDGADKMGAQVTKERDCRITRVGEKIRKFRLDEIPQLFNVFLGEMSFVGTRPEVPRYVQHYTNEMKATLLLPAGITSKASIEYKDEDKILKDAEDIDDVYLRIILPDKMRYNLQALKKFSIWNELTIMFQTILAVIRR